MVTRKVFCHQLSEDLKLDVIYENYPVIAGTDELSILLKLRFTGDITKYKLHEDTAKVAAGSANSSVSISVPTKPSAASGESWGQRISTQLSNATRSMFLQKFSSIEENEGGKDKLDDKDITMYLGYAQILGFYTVNDKIVDFSVFKDFQKKSLIGDKFAGIDTLDAGGDYIKNGTISQLKHVSSNHLPATTADYTDDNIHVIPFYSTNQNVLFGELTFERSQWSALLARGENSIDLTTKCFYLNMKLPKDLPPNFQSEATNIEYKLVIGYQLLENGKFIHKTVLIPLHIQPSIDKFGRQPMFHLENIRLAEKPDKFIAVDVNKKMGMTPAIKITTSKDEDNDAGSNNMQIRARRPSFLAVRQTLTKSFKPFQTLEPQFTTGMKLGVPKIRHRRSKSAQISFEKMHRETSTESGSNSTVNKTGRPWSDSFFQMVQMLDKCDVSDVSKIQEKFEKTVLRKGILEEPYPKDNVTQIINDYKSVQKQHYDPTEDENSLIDYIPMVPESAQTKYLIRENHLDIATLDLDRSIFRVGDLINLTLSFDDSDIVTKGVEVQLIRSQIFYREEYLQKGSYDEVYHEIKNDRNLETVVFEKLISTFDAQNTGIDILIPKETEPQFKTNFFDVKYYIQLRFILLDQYQAFKLRKEFEQKMKESLQEGSSNSTKNTEETGEEAENSNSEVDNKDSVGDFDFSSKLQRKIFDMQPIFIDKGGSMLFKGKEDFESGYEFTVRIPIVVFPSYEKDFGHIAHI